MCTIEHKNCRPNRAYYRDIQKVCANISPVLEKLAPRQNKQWLNSLVKGCVFMGFVPFSSRKQNWFSFQRQKNNKFDVAVRDVTIFHSTQKSSQEAVMRAQDQEYPAGLRVDFLCPIFTLQLQTTILARPGSRFTNLDGTSRRKIVTTLIFLVWWFVSDNLWPTRTLYYPLI
jgi:hypothetical protein